MASTRSKPAEPSYISVDVWSDVIAQVLTERGVLSESPHACNLIAREAVFEALVGDVEKFSVSRR